MSKKDFNFDKLNEISTLITRGLHGVALRELKNMDIHSIPRGHKTLAASLLRRLGLSIRAIQLLNPIIRPSSRRPIEATDSEKLEYSANLIRLGGRREALDLMQSIDPQKLPKKHLFQAFAHIAEWDYQKSNHELKNLLLHPLAEEYDQQIARVNLVLGYIFQEDYSQAYEILDSLIPDTLQKKQALLHSNSLELLAQIQILEKKYQQARQTLIQAQNSLVSSHTIDAFFIKKDFAILRAIETSGDLSHAKKYIYQIKYEALKKNYWEQARDCDYHLAQLTQDSKIFEKLFYGTPYRSYQQKILNNFHKNTENKTWNKMNYVWTLGLKSKSNAKFNLPNCQNLKDLKNLEFKPTQLPQKILQSLAQDFYRPRSLFEIFEFCFQNEHYLAKFSQDKIHQGIMRLRKQIADIRVPLEIAEQNSFYQLQTKSQMGVQIHFQDLATSSSKNQSLKVDNLIEKLLNERDHSNTKSWSASQISEILKVSERTCLRILKSAMERSLIYKTSPTRAARYRLADKFL